MEIKEGTLVAVFEAEKRVKNGPPRTGIVQSLDLKTNLAVVRFDFNNIEEVPTSRLLFLRQLQRNSEPSFILKTQHREIINSLAERLYAIQCVY